ncbi:MAG: hypothetical protein JST75_15745 [Bacteroidetes bacterium]|nr:hypothetical protein [Bacteroidota bacterium]
MKSIYNIFLTTIFSVSLNFSFCQNLQTNIKAQAMDMARALIKNDFIAFSEFVHPSIITYTGGKEKLKANIDSAASAMKQFGVQFKKILVGNPGPIINYKDQLQSIVPQTTTMQTMMGELEVETSLIAVSMDKGKKWYFIDTNVYKADKIKTALPDLSPQLVIPPQKQPKFTPNTQN